jgi:hypothetical protein
MSAQTVISHRMFVAALSHDENEESRKRRTRPSVATAANRAQPGRVAVASNPSAAVAQQMLLLSEAIAFQPTQG